MRFIDSNIFLHAFIETNRELKKHEISIKRKSKNIITKIEGGEKVVTSVVHISEIINVLDSLITKERALTIIQQVITNDNIKVIEVTKSDYASAIELAKESKAGINDCLSITLMQKNGIKEIYSSDKDFDNFKEIERII